MLNSADDIRARVNYVDSEILNSQIDPHIKSASRRIIRWVGADAYADAGIGSPVNADRADDLTNAEAALTLYFLLKWLQTNVTNRGMVKQAKEDGNTVNQFYSPKEVADFMQLYWDEAEQLCKPWQLTDDAISSVQLTNL
jgi:hypothetical protein